MNDRTFRTSLSLLAAVLAVLAFAAVPSSAQTMVDLCATTGTVALPDSTSVPIWGYVLGSSCSPGDATLPGPELRPAPGDTTLTVNLTNNLAEAVSFFVPGLRSTASGGTAGRFTAEAAPSGGTASYDFALTGRAGTFLYHSATDRIRTQMPMGLYGALVVDASGAEAYPGVTYDQDAVLLFSEIDPNLNGSPASFGGARVINWNPQYFLINGQASPDTAPIGVSTGANVLLRFVNAGLETVVPTLEGGLYMDLEAEDGNRYPHPMQQYGVELQAGKTIDAMIQVAADGTYALYDRALHLTNGTATVGGMRTDLQVSAAAGAPTAVDDAYSVAEDDSLTADGMAPNPAGVLDNDDGAAEAVWVSGPSSGTLSAGLAVDGSFSYTPNGDFNGTDVFTYVANDGLGGPNSNVATVTITVTPVNDPPTAAADAYDVIEGQTLNVSAPGVLANDVDVDGDGLTAAEILPAPPGTLTLNPDGSFAYTAAGIAGAVETFYYEACDAAMTCSSSSVTVTVTAPPANVAPTANDDFAQTPRNTAVVVNVVGNDTDSDGTVVPTSVVITTGASSQRGGTVVNNGNGTVTYSPRNAGFRGTDTFQYTVQDDDGATSNVATVRINVVR